MALRAYATYPTLGLPTVMNYLAGNDPAVVADPLYDTDDYCLRIDPVAGNEFYGARLMSRSDTAGISATINTLTPFIQGAFRITTAPDVDIEIATVSSISTPYSDTGRFASIRMRADRILRLHDLDDLTSGTATATGSTALTEDTVYVWRWQLNVTTGAMELKVYLWSTGALVDTLTVTGGNLGVAALFAIFFGWNHGAWVNSAGVQGDPYVGNGNATPTFVMDYGCCFVDDAAFVDFNTRSGQKNPSANGTHTSFTASGAAEKFNCVNTVPPDGNTTHLVSSTGGSSYTALLQSCAVAGITGTILGYSPYYIGWDVGGSVTIGTRLIENGTTTDTTLTDPGAVVDFHLRGRLFVNMPSDASAPTIAKLDACEVGVIQGAANVEIRVGSIAMHVAYVPAAAAGGGARKLITIINR